MKRSKISLVIISLLLVFVMLSAYGCDEGDMNLETIKQDAINDLTIEAKQNIKEKIGEEVEKIKTEVGQKVAENLAAEAENQIKEIVASEEVKEDINPNATNDSTDKNTSEQKKDYEPSSYSSSAQRQTNNKQTNKTDNQSESQKNESSAEPSKPVEQEPAKTETTQPTSTPTPTPTPAPTPTPTPKPEDKNTNNTQGNVNITKAFEIAKTDGAKSAQILNANTDKPEYNKILEEILNLYYFYTDSTLECKASADEKKEVAKQFEAFLAGVNGKASELCKKYKDAYDERQTDPVKLGYNPGDVIVLFKSKNINPITLLDEFKCTGYESLMGVNTTQEGEIGLYKIAISETVHSAIDIISKNENVESAGPNLIYTIERPSNNDNAKPTEKDISKDQSYKTNFDKDGKWIYSKNDGMTTAVTGQVIVLFKNKDTNIKELERIYDCTYETKIMDSSVTGKGELGVLSIKKASYITDGLISSISENAEVSCAMEGTYPEPMKSGEQITDLGKFKGLKYIAIMDGATAAQILNNNKTDAKYTTALDEILNFYIKYNESNNTELKKLYNIQYEDLTKQRDAFISKISDKNAIVAKAYNIAISDGATAAKILNSNKNNEKYENTLNKILYFYYFYSDETFRDPNGWRFSLTTDKKEIAKQKDIFLATVDKTASNLFKKYKDSYDELKKSSEELGYQPGEIVVVLKDTKTNPRDLESKYKCLGYRCLAAATNTGKGETGVYGVPVGETVNSTIQLFLKDLAVESAEPNRVGKTS